MRIEAYFQEFQKTIESCPFCTATNIILEKRSTHTGLLFAELTFSDDSILHIREFIDAELAVDRLMYAYQYMDASKKLIFRYDNTGHHKKLNLTTYPHHKHDGSEENVLASPSVDTSNVLDEIEMFHL